MKTIKFIIQKPMAMCLSLTMLAFKKTAMFFVWGRAW